MVYGQWIVFNIVCHCIWPAISRRSHLYFRSPVSGSARQRANLPITYSNIVVTSRPFIVAVSESLFEIAHPTTISETDLSHGVYCWESRICIVSRTQTNWQEHLISLYIQWYNEEVKGQRKVSKSYLTNKDTFYSFEELSKQILVSQ